MMMTLMVGLATRRILDDEIPKHEAVSGQDGDGVHPVIVQNDVVGVGPHVAVEGDARDDDVVGVDPDGTIIRADGQHRRRLALK